MDREPTMEEFNDNGTGLPGLPLGLAMLIGASAFIIGVPVTVYNIISWIVL